MYTCLKGKHYVQSWEEEMCEGVRKSGKGKLDGINQDFIEKSTKRFCVLLIVRKCFVHVPYC
ncbi:hypothetical protein M514_11480, partial [Trichuris suis]